MTKGATLAAAKVNELWLDCLNNSTVDLATCPSNEEVAKVITNHCDCSKKEGSHA